MNESLFLWLNAIGAFLPDALWIHITNLGDASVALAVLLPLYRFNKEPGAAIFVIALVATLVVQGMKAYFGELRPPAVLAEGSFNLIGEAIKTHSFPSGHTATAFVCAGLLVAQYRSLWVSCAAFLVASLVGLSRIMVGAHWPTDVVVGAIVGLSIGFFGYQLLERFQFKLGWQRAVGGFAVLIVVAHQFIYTLPYQEFIGVKETGYLYALAALIGGVKFIWSLDLKHLGSSQA